MKPKSYKIIFKLFIIAVLSFAFISTSQQTINAQPGTNIQEQQCISPICVKQFDLMNNTSKYINKKVCLTSRFSKFSTIGLDYKPAFRSSEKYISFLLLREDALHNIPLSELKIFILRKTAEKLPDIKEGDTVKVEGIVFSNALGDVWLDAASLEIIKK